MAMMWKCVLFALICMAIFVEGKKAPKKTLPKHIKPKDAVPLPDPNEVIEDIVDSADGDTDNKNIKSKDEDVNDDSIDPNAVIEDIVDTDDVDPDNKNIKSKDEDINDNSVDPDAPIEDIADTDDMNTNKKNNGVEIKDEVTNIATIKDDAPNKGLKAKVCLDRRGDCAAVKKFCPALKGLCDKTCGYCKGILGHKDTFVFGLEKITLKRSNLIAVVPYIGKEYSVTFDLLPTVFGSGYRSVIHFTAGNRNHGRPGDRQPAIWFPGASANSLKNRFYICADVSGNVNHCYTTNTFIERGKWVQVSISQKHVFGGHYYSISIDGHVIYTLRNTRPRVAKRVYVYGGDPWHHVAEGTIRNLVIKTSE